MHVEGTALAGLRERVGDHLGIDGRALAAFRVLLGAILLLDLLLRARNLGTLYTDNGLYPIAVLSEQYPVAVQFSVHALSGALWYQALLFIVAGVCAVCLVVGYRTRVATVACLYLLASLHIRNPNVLSGGDALLQHLMFWAVFLPLGERWSVDARRASRARTRIVSVATVALLIQVLLVYGVNAVLKFESESWLSGTAVETVFRIDRYTEWLGPIVAEFPLLLQTANWVWVALLAASPLLVVFTGRLRALLVGAFVSVHLGMFATMQLGIFPLVSIAALVPFLPSECWDAVDQKTATWGLRHASGDLLATLAGTVPSVGARLSNRSLSVWISRITHTVLAVVLVTLVAVNAIAVGFLPVPPPADDVLSGNPADSRWTLFAPHPPQTEQWVTAQGQLESGAPVDVLSESPLRWRNPDEGHVTYSTARMRKYAASLGESESSRAAFADYLCDWWHRTQETNLTSLSITRVSRPPGGTDAQFTRTVLSTHDCEAGATQGKESLPTL